MAEPPPRHRRGRLPRRLARARKLRLVNVSPNDLGAAVEIQHATFARYVEPSDLRRLEETLGYEVGPGGNGLHLSRDPRAGFHRSTWNGAPCVYVTIEGVGLYIFA